MTIEAKKKAALAFVSQMPTGKIDRALLADSFRFWSPIAEMPGDEFLGVVGKIGDLFKPGAEIIVTGITAEDNRVAIEAHAVGEFINDVAYRNQYHFLFFFEGDKISRMHEHMDSKHVSETMMPLLMG